MGVLHVCDVCGNDLHIENQSAEFKIPKGYWLSPGYDGFTAYLKKKKLDICFNCWHKFKEFVKKEGE